MSDFSFSDLFGSIFTGGSGDGGYTYTNSELVGTPADLSGGDGYNFLSNKFYGPSYELANDFVGPPQQYAAPNQGYTYTSNDFVGPPQYTQAASPSLWDLVQQAGSVVESPGGKFMAGLAGAGISAYGANQQNKNNKKAYKKQQEMLAARQAKQAQYDSPLRLVNGRQQLAVPQQRNGETVFFANNRLPSYFAAEGGSISEEDYAQMVAEAQQARADAQMDRPSMVGFLRYLANGKRMPSELAAAKRAQRTVPDVIQTRQRKIDEAANYAQGGSPNYVAGGTPGQADKIPAQLSDGEYVMDADVVSALGDGNNAAGAAKLDQMRQNIRSHKRSAPANSIPPKAKSPLAYMKKGAK